jgi:creatinine amidohydrolase
MKTWIPDARNFAYLTWKQVDQLPRDTTLLVLRTAAIEQHGYHLPLATDTLINNLLLGRALDLVSPDLHIYALPPVCYGKSNEHLGFPGTLSVSSSTFLAVVREIGSSVAAGGFRKLALYNTHGGNTSLVDVLARDLRAEFGLTTFSLFGSPGASFDTVSPQERQFGFHAGEIETAFLLHATPELVARNEYSANYIARVDKPEVLKPEGSSANFAWLTRDISDSGVLGDPTAATAENGERWISEAAARIAEILVAMYHFTPRSKVDPHE